MDIPYLGVSLTMIVQSFREIWIVFAYFGKLWNDRYA